MICGLGFNRLDHFNTDGILHGPDIAQDIFCGDPLGMDDGAQIQGIHHGRVVDAVDLGNDLGIGYRPGKEREEDILFVDAGQGYEGLRSN